MLLNIEAQGSRLHIINSQICCLSRFQYIKTSISSIYVLHRDSMVKIHKPTSVLLKKNFSNFSKNLLE